MKRWNKRGIVAAVGAVLAWAASAMLLFQGNVGAGTLEGRPEVGAKLFDASNCRNCHSINHQGSEVGPDLTQVGVRRSRDWLVEFVAAPQQKFPYTLMPQFPWKDKQQVADVVAYLLTLKKPVDRKGIMSDGGPEIEIGKALVEAFDCRACHIIRNGGRSRYPNLTHVGSKIYREWEQEWLMDPQKIKPGTFMPTFGFTKKEASAIAAYLESLK